MSKRVCIPNPSAKELANAIYPAGCNDALQHCDYTTECIEFLKGLENAGPDAELLIVGDTFGFWELTLVQGVEKIDHIITAHQAIFDRLRVTGARIMITMMVGNHDYDLGCNTDFAAKLRAYNISIRAWY